MLASDSHPPCPGLSSTLSTIAEVVLGQLGHQTQRHEDRHFPDRSFTLQHSLVLVTLVHTLSDVLDDFLLRLRGASLSGLVLGVQILGTLRALLLIDFSSITSFLCASLGPRCSLLLPATSSFTASSVGILLGSHSLSIPPKGTISRDRSLWLFAAHVSSTMACLMLSRHPSLCSLTSALIYVVLHTSLESPPAGCARQYASCAHAVHDCLSLKGVLSSRLRDSTTAWSAEAVNTTGAVVVRGETSCVPSLFFSYTAAR